MPGVVSTVMRQLLPRIYSGLEAALDLFSPPHCLLCEAPLDPDRFRALCPPCWRGLPRFGPRSCVRCGRPASMRVTPGGGCADCHRKRQAYATVLSIGPHENSLRDLVHQLKYRDRPEVARPLARLLASTLSRTGRLEQTPIDLVVPVPLGRKRLRERGYDQALLLARGLGRHLERPVYRTLIRIIETPPQTGQTAPQRRRNVRGAFRVRRRLTGRPNVLLVDDVLTTGATAGACARALRSAGARRVHVASATRSVAFPRRPDGGALQRSRDEE